MANQVSREEKIAAIELEIKTIFKLAIGYDNLPLYEIGNKLDALTQVNRGIRYADADDLDKAYAWVTRTNKQK